LIKNDAKKMAILRVCDRTLNKCGGAPEITPRRFTMEIDLKTWAAQWGNNDEMEMKPIP
jgi:hypothetical protein